MLSCTAAAYNSPALMSLPTACKELKHLCSSVRVTLSLVARGGNAALQAAAALPSGVLQLTRADAAVAAEAAVLLLGCTAGRPTDATPSVVMVAAAATAAVGDAAAVALPLLLFAAGQLA
jgi:hypothetical protein